ncbi:MAG: cyclic nucleotide-binding domain-containing protein, partial [Acidobacteriota bacterium]
MSKNPLQEYHIQYRAGDTIFEQGDVGTEMFIVRSGMVKIYRNIEGKKESLAVLEKGDFFGEMAVLEGTPRSDNAEALEDVELVRIHSAVFDRMIRRNTEIAVRMILKLSRRVEEANGRLESFFQNASKSAPAQVPVIEEQPPPAPEPEVVVDAVPPDCLAALLLEG